MGKTARCLTAAGDAVAGGCTADGLGMLLQSTSTKPTRDLFLSYCRPTIAAAAAYIVSQTKFELLCCCWQLSCQCLGYLVTLHLQEIKPFEALCATAAANSTRSLRTQRVLKPCLCSENIERCFGKVCSISQTHDAGRMHSVAWYFHSQNACSRT